MAVEAMDADDLPDDGKTIDGSFAEADEPPEVVLPPSKLPATKQFEVLQGWFQADATHSREWRGQARDAFAFRAGEQWTDEDKALLDSQQRPHIVFNRVLTILKAVAGMEINGRHEVAFLPRNNEDTAANEVLSGASKWMSDNTDGEDEESQAFDHTCTTGMGWCLSDDAMVRLPNTHFATTRLYSGSVVQIDLENGQQLTGTPNHPVLTDAGWKRLCDLNEGDNLINSRILERIKGFPVEQFDQVETRLKDKIDAFRTGREALRVATAPDDFYADGAGSKVHVVYADGLLLDKFKAALLGKMDKSSLARCDFDPARGGFLFNLRHYQGALYSAVSQAALGWTHATAGVLDGILLGAKRMAMLDQLAADNVVGASELCANFNGRQSVFKIKPSQFVSRDGEFKRCPPGVSKGEAGGSKAGRDGAPGYAEYIRDFTDWKPILEVEALHIGRGDIGAFTRVAAKVRFPVHDFPVHDVGTSVGFFIAGDIITSNTEERMSYEDDPTGLYVQDCVDPREMYWDRKATKKNLSDAQRMARARRMSLGDAMALFPGKTRTQLDALWAEDTGGDVSLRSIEEKRRRTADNVADLPYDDQIEVLIVQMQWWEREVYWIVADPQTNTKAELSDEQYRVFAKRMKMLGMTVEAARMMRKVYKQAWLGSELLKMAAPAPVKGQFSWKCITGEFDAVKKTWFGLVKVLRDPQMWANKWLSQILHILNTTAKGGILAEESAFADQREAENGYARPDTITWLADGALSGPNPKIIPKPGGGLTEGYVGLMTFAISSLRDVSGINLELLGQQDQNQPGVLEAMRKQAGMTVLATLFDSLRRFRKQVGRTRLYFIQTFLSDGRLIRVVGPDSVKAIALAMDKTAGEYDVVVDDTPTSPNQKEANWAIIQPLLGVFKEQLMANPEVFAMLLEYSPLPARIVEAIKAFVKQAQNDPQAQADRQQMKQLQIGREIAAMNKDQSAAELNYKKAGSTEATAMYDIAMARNLLEDNKFNDLKIHLDGMEAAAKARKAEADARKSEAQVHREHAGLLTDQTDAGTRRLAAHADLTRAAGDAEGEVVRAHADAAASRVGSIIDHLAGTAGAHRDMAAAAKDHAMARRADREPIQPAGAR